MVKRKVLMCLPDYYGIEYEINPWMDMSRQPNKKLACSQWQKLKQELENAGVVVTLIQPVSGLPDMAFTANAGLTHNQNVVLSNFKHLERRGETNYFDNYFLAAGYVCDMLPYRISFEGEGDALFCGNGLVCGYGMRSDERGVRFAAAIIGIDPVVLKLVNPFFYHLDTCFSYLEQGVVLCYLPAFDEPSQKKIEQIGEVIPVSEFDAKNFVCNAVPVGNKCITSPMSKGLRAKLEKRGIESVEVEMSEFIKAGGAAKCLMLWI